MPKTPEQLCPYGCGRTIPEGAGRLTCGKQPCRGMAISAGIRDSYRLKAQMGHALTVEERLDLASEFEMQPTGQCQIFYGAIATQSGYGYLRGDDGKMVLAHRAALEIKLGRPIRDGMDALHVVECSEPRCVLGDHLYEGTRSEQVFDSVKRGTHGRKNYHITPAVAEIIRQIVYVEQLSNKEIGKDYGISAGQVNAIAHRRAYSDRPLNDWEREALKRRNMKKRRDNQKGRRKLSPQQVEEIKASNETQGVLAKRYGVAQSVISKAKRGVYDSDWPENEEGREARRLSWKEKLRKQRKFTDEEIMEVRASNELQSVLAKRYGTNQGFISAIRLRKTYRDVQ